MPLESITSLHLYSPACRSIWILSLPATLWYGAALLFHHQLYSDIAEWSGTQKIRGARSLIRLKTR